MPWSLFRLWFRPALATGRRSFSLWIRFYRRNNTLPTFCRVLFVACGLSRRRRYRIDPSPFTIRPRVRIQINYINMSLYERTCMHLLLRTSTAQTFGCFLLPTLKTFRPFQTSVSQQQILSSGSPPTQSK